MLLEKTNSKQLTTVHTINYLKNGTVSLGVYPEERAAVIINYCYCCLLTIAYSELVVENLPK